MKIEVNEQKASIHREASKIVDKKVAREIKRGAAVFVYKGNPAGLDRSNEYLDWYDFPAGKPRVEFLSKIIKGLREKKQRDERKRKI